MPSKKITRRAVSIKGLIHQRARKYCAATGIPVSRYMEQLLEADLARKQWPVETQLEPRPHAEREEAAANSRTESSLGVGGIVSF
jgi:hypothetical protein